MATKVYRDLPWAQIRREWEHTSISIAALAREYNIRSRHHARAAAGDWRNIGRGMLTGKPPYLRRRPCQPQPS